MPVRMTVELEPAGVHPKGPPDQVGPALQAAVLDAVRDVDAQLSQRVHDWHGPKPMALTPLLDRNRVEVGLLDDGLLAAVEEALRPGRHLRFGRSRYVAATTQIRRYGWTDLAQSPPAAPWTLRFLTPTTFHTNRGGKVRCNRPVPDPELLFGSLLRRWQAHAEVTLPGLTEDLLAWSVMVASYRVKSAAHLVHTRPRAEEVGFTGVATFTTTSHRRVPETVVHGIGALAALGVFAGVGAHTMQGMGCIRVLRERA